MMGDSEGSFTDQRIPAATLNQIGAVCNSSINNSQVNFVNAPSCVVVYFVCNPPTEPQHEGTGVHHEGSREQREDTGQQPEEDELDGDSDEHKELINSFSLSGSHERQRASSIQETGHADDDEKKELVNSLSGSHDAHLDGNPQEGDEGLAPEAEAGETSRHPTPTHMTPNTTQRRFTLYEEEVSISDASDTYVKVDIDEDIAVGEPSEEPQLLLDSPPFVPKVPVVGSPMPLERFCKITPHPCSVYSSQVWKYTRPLGFVGNFIRRETKSSRRVCLVGNALCISSSTRDVIEYVVDLAEKALCVDGCDLTVGRWVITLPENKLSEWKSVSVRIKSRTAPGCAQWSSSPDVRAEAKRKARSLPQASSVTDLLEDNEVTKPEECQGTDEPVPVFKSTASMCSSTTDLQ